MGQYYKIICLNRREELSKKDYGAKLMESAWAGNVLTTSLYYMLMNDWNEKIVVNVGDYADTDDDWSAVVNKLDNTKLYKSLYDTANDYSKVDRISSVTRADLGLIYGLNLDKKEFVNLNVLPVTDVYEDAQGKTVYAVEPILLLIAIGNGLGGGDYFTEDASAEYVGRWVGDRISVSEFVPDGYTEIVPNFKEYYTDEDTEEQYYNFAEKKFVKILRSSYVKTSL